LSHCPMCCRAVLSSRGAAAVVTLLKPETFFFLGGIV